MDKLDEIILDVLDFANTFVGTRTVFVARLNHDRFHVTKIINNQGINLKEGQEYIYEETLCRHVNVGDCRKPLIIPDTSLDDRVKDLVHTAGLNIGCYLAIPIELEDNSLFGTLCAADSTPYSFSEYEVNKMQKLGVLLARIIDISRSTKTENEKIRIDNFMVMRELAADLADQIGNPLQIIKGFFQISKDNYGRMQEYAAVIEGELSNLERGLREFLLHTNPKYPIKHEANIVHILMDVINHIKSEIETNIGIELSIQSPIPNSAIDEEQIQYVLKNILLNGIEATKHGEAVIKVMCSSSNNEIRIEFEDNGTGIGMWNLDLVGQPFYTTKSNAKGLGLSITNRILEGHDGTVTIESKEKGTKVILCLPVG